MQLNKTLVSTSVTSLDYQKTLTTHKNFLVKFKTLPETTRKATYKELLILPNNYSHLQQITKPYMLLPEHRNNKQVALVSDILGRLYPDLQNQWIPSMIHPFVKLFQQDFTFAFQSSLCFLLNWLKPILLDFPNINKQVLQIFQLSLPNLKQKVESLNYPLSSLINPIFVVSLTDILNRKDWLQVCDFWVTNPFEPWHLVSVVIAIVQIVEDKLVNLESVEEMSLLLRKEKSIHVSIILQKTKQVSKKFQKQFISIYKDSVFPLQGGRYPVHKFFRAPIRKTNSKLEHLQDIQLQQIKQKYNKLESLLQKFIHSSHTSSQEAINQKYQMVEGQLQQYIKLIKQEHNNKMTALRDIQSKFNAQLDEQGQKRENKVSVIQKRARLQREIDLLMDESEAIRKMEDDMVKRMQQALKMKKNELRKIGQV